VTAPLRAYRPVLVVAPVLRVMDVSARMLPAKSVPVPRVAKLPTCQNTLHGCARLISNTFELLAVVRVLPIWIMKTLLGFPWPSRVSCPVN
jgi:hypothetical protein